MDEMTEHITLTQDSMKTVSKQLENLEGYGIIRSSPKGWKWMK